MNFVDPHSASYRGIGVFGRARRTAKAIIPPRYHAAVRTAGFRALNYGAARFCPCCNSHVRAFKPFGYVSRPDAQCPVCGALERDRLVALLLDRNPALLDRAHKVLHVAPERPLAQRLRRRRDLDYISIDIEPGAAMRVMDVTDLKFADDMFDSIYCSNVLEHVPDDRRAMRELHRVLRPDGWAIVLVPLAEETTSEDLTIRDPAQRARLYGQPDHVRQYGLDVTDRLAEAGFEVRVELPAVALPPPETIRMGLDRNEIVFICRKPMATTAGMATHPAAPTGPHAG